MPHPAPRLRLARLALVCALAAGACSRDSRPAASFSPRARSQAIFTDGDFETGPVDLWNVEHDLNKGLAVAPPSTRADLQLQPGGVAATRIVSGPAGSVDAAGLASGELLVPRFGSGAVVVNELGMDKNVNGIHQQVTVTNADVDPSDGRVHVRFALAPVLENPGHPPTEQPYFWVELKNVTTGDTLFHTFNYSNEPGIAWKTSAAGPLYTDWQSFDVAPGDARLAVGDEVALEIIAAGCARGGHFGQLYVDGIGAFLPGLSVAATAPAAVDTGASLTYTLSWRNGGSSATTHTTIEQVLPAGTTYASATVPTGAVCSLPTPGQPGTVRCDVGTVNPGATGSLEIVVNVTAPAGSTIYDGDYRILADGTTPLLGPLVQTAVTSGVTYADLAVTVSDGVPAVDWGSAVTTTITVTNRGPSDAPAAVVQYSLPALLTGNWTCTSAGSAACGAASGTGSFAETVSLPVGGSVSYIVLATVHAGSGTGALVQRATVDPGSGVTDPAPSDDTAIDVDTVGGLDLLMVDKTGAGTGTVVSSPAGIACGTACGVSFGSGSSVVLTATADLDSVFTGWSGACSGTSPTCTVAVLGTTHVTATFVPAYYVTGTSTGAGTVTCTSPVASGASSTCTFTPAPRNYLAHVTDNAVDATSAASGGTYVISAVTEPHTVAATFSGSQSATTLSGAPASPVNGQAVTLTAAVSALVPAGAPGGTVSFSEGGTVLCGAQPIVNGEATCTVPLDVGSHSFVARYSGDARYPPSASPALGVTVAKAATTTAPTVLPSPAALAEAVTITVDVSAASPGTGTPTGTVTLKDGADVLGTTTLVGGVATFTTSTLATGIHLLTAEYSGDASFLASTGAASLEVSREPTSIALASSRNPSRRGRPVVLTASVTTSGGGAPSGTVTFRDGAALLGTAPLAGGVASITVRDLVKGTHPLTAEYGGSGTLAGATAALAQVVENSPPVAGAGTALDLGPAAALRATVSDPSGAISLPSGTVELWARPGWTGTGPSDALLFRIGDAASPRLAVSLAPARQGLVAQAGAHRVEIPAPLDDGRWHHLGFTTDGAVVVVTLDGVELSRFPDAPSAATQLVLGDGFVGQLDEVRVWSSRRGPADLGATCRTPLTGGEAGLVGYWRLDEGGGTELFDASPSHLDGTVTVASGGAAFTPSLAWRPRALRPDRTIAPVDAGYDVDGDPLVLSVVAPPSHGTATVDAPQLQIDYRCGNAQPGDDLVGFRLDDGDASSEYTVEVAMDAVGGLSCATSASCPAGQLCVQGTCIPRSELELRSGSAGCASGGDPMSAAGMLLAALVAWAVRERRRVLLRRAGRIGVVILAVAVARTAEGQEVSGFALQTFEPTPPADQLFTVPDAGVEGDLTPAGSLTFSWATEPLLLRRDGTPIPGGRIVHRQFWGFAGASVAIANRLLLDLSLPVALYQSGSQPLGELAHVSSVAMGDVRLGARIALLARGPWRLATGLDVFVPAGSRDGFTSDGTARALPKLVASRDVGERITLAAQAGVLVRAAKDVVVTGTGTALAFGAGATYRLGAFRVGPEIYGRYQFRGSVTSPVEGLLGGHWRHGPLDLGLALSTAFDRAPGASPLRAILQAAWRPQVEPAREEPREPAASPSEPAQEAPSEPPAAPEAVAEETPPPPAPAPAEHPAPPPPNACPVLAECRGDHIELHQSVQFGVGRARILPASDPMLTQVARILAEHPEIKRLEIEGHTDSTGRRAFNVTLSRRRAESVRRWLIERGGVDPHRLVARGYGPDHPIATNATRAGRAKNRRVEMKITAS